MHAEPEVSGTSNPSHWGAVPNGYEGLTSSLRERRDPSPLNQPLLANPRALFGSLQRGEEEKPSSDFPRVLDPHIPLLIGAWSLFLHRQELGVNALDAKISSMRPAILPSNSLNGQTLPLKLSKYAPHIVTDERRKAKKFVMGLKPSLRTRLVAFDHRTLDEALSAACRQEGKMEQYLEEKKASQKRPAASFQWQDKKKAVYQTQQRSVVVGNAQVPSVRSPGVKKECPHCGKTHGGSECWMITGKCLKCGSSDHKIKDCPRLQQGAQRGAPAPAAV
ncbi:hypothetical protein Taro_023623 [Colocasia esculenta]|uniref:CCHC-type domain-containing protein n=1 Tax=Colocasia esculenta TaxID=4460 RepID=A0A843VC11_COLES|nr:hypothetical protein [Colocasia esculenta]